MCRTSATGTRAAESAYGPALEDPLSQGAAARRSFSLTRVRLRSSILCVDRALPTESPALLVPLPGAADVRNAVSHPPGRGSLHA